MRASSASGCFVLLCFEVQALQPGLRREHDPVVESRDGTSDCFRSEGSSEIKYLGTDSDCLSCEFSRTLPPTRGVIFVLLHSFIGVMSTTKKKDVLEFPCDNFICVSMYGLLRPRRAQRVAAPNCSSGNAGSEGGRQHDGGLVRGPEQGRPATQPGLRFCSSCAANGATLESPFSAESKFIFATK